MPAAVWSSEEPYNALPPLRRDAGLESREVLKAAIPARTALSELSQAVRLIPNQNILISTLPLLEARASSEIENIVTTADKLFQALPAGNNADPATREALRYREALMAGFDIMKARPLGVRTAETIATRIRGVETRVRTEQDVKLVNSHTGAVIYTPPRGERLLRDLLADWEVFLHEEGSVLDPLVRLAMGHYQFEAIHPFTDGNGRTGRVLNSLYLIETGLLTSPVLYLSRYFLENRTEYYQLLLDVTSDAAWQPWLLFVIQGVEQTAAWTLAKIDAMRDLMSATRDYVRGELPRIYRQELLDVVFMWPYARIANVVDSGLMERQTASKHLHELVRIGVLEERNAGREKVFVNTRLLQLLTTDSNNFAGY